MNNNFESTTPGTPYTFSGDYTVIGSAHEVVCVPKEKTTATFAGMNAHYECTKCGALFEDEAGENEKSYDYFVPKVGSFYVRFLEFFRKIIRIIKKLFAH